MKFRHIVLFGIVASIMAYLNNTLEEEKTDDKQESILDELKELIDNKFEDIDIEKKLEEIKELKPSAPGAEIMEGKLLNRAADKDIDALIKMLIF